jgi:hypothetical protein
MASKLILTDVPFTLEDIQLGSLIPNIRTPHQDALAARTAISGKDYTIRTHKNFKTLLNSEHALSFSAYLTKLLSIEHSPGSKVHLELSSKEGIIYEMSQPKKWFKDLCKLKEVQDWLQEGIDDGQDTFMITGFRTLRDAKLEQRGEASSQTKFQADVPVGEVMGGVAPGDVAHVGFKGSHTSKEEHEDTAEMEGERIYALCYRKVRHSWHGRKSVDNAFLQSRNIWRAFSDTRSDDEDGKFLEVDIEDIDEEFKDGTPETKSLRMEVDNEVYFLRTQ